MTKLKSFVRLDFVTIKPYFTIKNLLIYACVAIFLTSTSGNISAGLGVGMMLGTMFISYPFALGENNNMDALYTTMAIKRKTVVTGRYLFALVLDLCCIAFSFVFAAVSLITSRQIHFEGNADGIIQTIAVLAAVFILVQAIQLPIFFKFGYSKAKLFTLIPFCAIMVSYFIITGLSKKMLDLQNLIWIGDFISKNQVIVILAAIALLGILVYISYNLSLMFYKKREF